VDHILRSLALLDPMWMYVMIFAIAFIENIFPPAPSDVAVVAGGALAALEKGNFFIALLSGALGSTLGFMTMYAVGKWTGAHLLETGRIPFIKPASLRKLEQWFYRFGYWIIVANRFLAGTRAIVSFFAGMSRLPLVPVVILSFLSSVIWYGILVFAGYTLGEHWERVGSYLASYSEVVTGLVILGVALWFIRYVIKKRSAQHPDV
jgi:membrane protein DedA with SNARE-associated domain